MARRDTNVMRPRVGTTLRLRPNDGYPGDRFHLSRLATPGLGRPDPGPQAPRNRHAAVFEAVPSEKRCCRRRQCSRPPGSPCFIRWLWPPDRSRHRAEASSARRTRDMGGRELTGQRWYYSSCQRRVAWRGLPATCSKAVWSDWPSH
jgi:hypothetical protein